MAITVNAASLAALQTRFNAIFNKQYTGYKQQYDKMAMVIETKAQIEVYAWLEQMGMVREWIGARTINQLKRNGYSLTNKKWENTFAVPREAVEYDTVGTLVPDMQMFANSVAIHPDYELFKLAWGGLTDLCWDGKAFFATDHPIGDSTFSNLKTGVASALATDGVAFGAALTTIRQTLAGNGVRTPITYDPKFTLMCGPALETTAKQLLNAEFLPMAANTATSNATQSNIFKGAADLFINPILSQDFTGDANADKLWILYVNNLPLKPWIYQKFGAPEITPRTKLDDPIVFDLDQFVWGARIIDVFGYGLPQLAIASNGHA